MNNLVWLGIGGTAIFLMVALSQILTPFLVAFVLAYLLEPVTQWLITKTGLARNKVVLIVFTILILAIIIGSVYLWPILYREIKLLVVKIPEYSNYLQHTFTPYAQDALNSLEPETADRVMSALRSGIKQISSLFLNQVANFWNYTVATINFLISLLVTLLALFHFMRDWPKLIEQVISLVPIKYKSWFDQLCHNIDQIINHYVKGQFNVCSIFAIYYVIGLSCIGVNFAVLLGILSGFIIIIPLLGTPTVLISTLIVTYHTYGYDARLVYVLILYALGNVAESTVVTPKIIGDRIGLHPIWIIIAILSGGQFLGLVGIILAVPMACIIKVLLQAIIRSYKNSKLYLRS